MFSRSRNKNPGYGSGYSHDHQSYQSSNQGHGGYEYSSTLGDSGIGGSFPLRSGSLRPGADVGPRSFADKGMCAVTSTSLPVPLACQPACASQAYVLGGTSPHPFCRLLTLLMQGTRATREAPTVITLHGPSLQQAPSDPALATYREELAESTTTSWRALQTVVARAARGLLSAASVQCVKNP